MDESERRAAKSGRVKWGAATRFGCPRLILLTAVMGAGPLGVASADPSACPAAGPGATGGTVYYVSVAGNDANSGTSPCTPWRTMAKVDGAGLQPGDTVAFKGGDGFDAPLAPWRDESGTGDRPILFTSYGTGQATLLQGVFLKSVSYLTFSDLNISNPRAAGVFSSKAGTGVTNIVVRQSTVAHTLSYGIASTSSADANWAISNNTIRDTGDSGIFSQGSDLTVRSNTIAQAGTNTAISWPRHGIYAKGPRATILGNSISGCQTAGISLRFQGNLVANNVIYGGQKGIDFNSETDAAGITQLLGNTVTGASDTGISVSAGARALHETLVIAANHVSDAGNYALYIISGSPSIRLSGNLFQTSGRTPYLNLPGPMLYTSATYQDNHDRWAGSRSPTPYYIGGSGRSLRSYSRLFSPR